MIIRNNAIAALLAFGAPLLGVPVMAADGEILISQAAVNAGGITPGDAAGFPATLSRPGRYKLSGNLRVPTDHVGIEVTTKDVTIDLNGFTIRSDPPGAAVGAIFVSNGDRVRVANGTIVGFGGYGLNLFGGPFSTVENMRIIDSGGIFHAAIYFPIQGRIRNNTIVNGSFGIVGCSECLVEQNVITGSAIYGVGIAGGQAINNIIVGNGSHGLSVSAPPARTGYGGNILVGNNGGGQQVNGGTQLHPNVCSPDCP